VSSASHGLSPSPRPAPCLSWPSWICPLRERIPYLGRQRATEATTTLVPARGAPHQGAAVRLWRCTPLAPTEVLRWLQPCPASLETERSDRAMPPQVLAYPFLRGLSKCCPQGLHRGVHMPLPLRFFSKALVGFQGRGCADVVQPNCGHPFLLEALLFQWPQIRRQGYSVFGKGLQIKPKMR
jgi:hypothetical protein